MFERAAELLHPLLGDLVFVGRSTTGLLVTDDLRSALEQIESVLADLQPRAETTGSQR